MALVPMASTRFMRDVPPDLPGNDDRLKSDVRA